MQKQAPSVFQIATIAGFALSCFGILLFLWISFGGPTPLKAQGYKFDVPVTEASLLANQSDVRLSGVSVGKVSKIELGQGKNAGSAVATIELDDAYAPIPADTRAILRQKTLLGETYVELSPGDSEGAYLPDGGELPAAQVGESVQLDEIFRTFDSKTRVAFQTWMQDAAVGFKGRGADLNAALGLLEPTFRDANDTLQTLDTQSQAVRQLVKNTGVVFSALSARQGQLSSLIRNTNRVFTTTAERQEDLQNLFIVLPTFLDESQTTLTRLDRFATNTDSLVQQLRPSARDLAPVLQDTQRLAPYLEGFFRGLRPVIAAAPRGFPALRKFLNADLPPLLGRIPSFFDQLDPLLVEASQYKHEITSFFANAAAATNAVSNAPETAGQNVKYLRTAVPLGPDSVASYPDHRLKVNRVNPYMKPMGYLDLAKGGLKSFETSQCTNGINAKFRDWDELTLGEQNNFTESTGEGEVLYQNLKKFAFTGLTNSNDLAAPPCVQQSNYKPIGKPGQTPTRYQHVLPDG